MTTINMFDQGHGFWYKVKKHIWMKWLHKPDIRKYDFDLMKDTTDSINNVFPTIYPNWDHTPRSGYKGICVANSSPENWKKALEMMLDRIIEKPMDKRILFVKSWNEWAEGNYLEPDLKYGHQYLDVLKEVMYKQ